MKISLTLFFRLGLMALLSACTMELATDLDVEGTIVVGIPEGKEPFLFEDDEGEWSGVFVDMVRDLGLYLNRKTEVNVLDAGDLKAAVRAGEVALAFMERPSSDESDKNEIRFSDEFAWLGLAFLTGPESELTQVDALNAGEIRVAVIRSTRADQFARTALPKASVKVVEDEDGAVNKVLEREADAFVHDSLRIFENVDGRTDNLRAVLEPFRRVGIVAAVYAENEALLEAVNDFFHDYREIGGFDRLADRYFADAKEAFAVQGADFLFDPPERVVIEDSEAEVFSLE
jgi:ABC-type amino acid transport substrate-binding protein